MINFPTNTKQMCHNNYTNLFKTNYTKYQNYIRPIE